MIDRQVPANFQGWLEALWLAALAAYVLAGATLVPFHGDEATQIYMGRDYFYLFQDGDLEAVAFDRHWLSQPTEQHLRLINGTVTKTIHGFLAASAGMRREELNGQWDWSLDYVQNQSLGHLPEAQLLGRARLASAAQLAVSATLFYLLIRMAIDRPTALVASGLYAFHPAILLNGRRAMMEGPHMLGMILVLLAAAWLLRGQRWWRFVLLGVASGFAVAAKHPNAVVVALVFFACAAYWLYPTGKATTQERRRSARALVGLLAAGGVALFTFYLMNPAWWQAPLDSAAEVLRLRVELLNEQVALYGGYESWSERISGILEYAFFGRSQYYEVAQWEGYDAIRRQISAYEASGYAGLAIDGVLAALVMAGLTFWGMVYLARARQIDREDRWLLLVWGGGIAAITLLVTPLPWQRYYLPVLPFAQLAAACAVVHLIRLLWHHVASRVHHDRSLSN